MKGKTEYRIICSGTGGAHRLHIYTKPSLQRAHKAALKNNVDSVFTDPIPAYTGCLPWLIETRDVGSWETTT